VQDWTWKERKEVAYDPFYQDLDPNKRCQKKEMVWKEKEELLGNIDLEILKVLVEFIKEQASRRGQLSLHSLKYRSS
jgi:hypothetical protein